MFLFISTASPISSAVSIAFFLASICLSATGLPAFSFLAPLYPYWHALQAYGLPLVCMLVPLATMIYHAADGQQRAAGVARPVRPSLSMDQLKLLVQRLPIERWLCEASRATLSVREIRARLALRRIPMSGLLERHELVKALEGAPHETICSICHEDYRDGDALRLLPCNHYHHCGARAPTAEPAARPANFCLSPLSVLPLT